MRKILLTIFFVLPLLGLQLFAAPIAPPKLADVGINVAVKGGVRNPLREMPHGVLACGKNNFFYYGIWHSQQGDAYKLKVGAATELVGYTGTSTKIKGSGTEVVTGSSNAFFVLTDASGKVQWAISSDDGNFDDLVATVSGDRIYVLAAIKPVWRGTQREANDHVLAKWSTAPNTYAIEENFAIDNHDNFIAPTYIYVIELDLSGKILRTYKPLEDAQPAISKGDLYFFPYHLLVRDQKLFLHGKIRAEVTQNHVTRQFGIRYGEGALKELGGEKRGKHILATIDLSKETPFITELAYVADQEKISSFAFDDIYQTSDALYFAMTCTSRGNPFVEDISFLGKTLIKSGEKGGFFLLKTDLELKNIGWIQRLPAGTNAKALTSYGDKLYVSGSYDKEAMWGTTKLTYDIDGNNQAFWGTVNIADGSLDKAQYVQAGYAEGDGIAVTKKHVYWQFIHKLADFGSYDTNSDILFGDGKQYKLKDTYSDEDEIPQQVALAVYDRTTNELQAFSEAFISKTYLSLPTGMPNRTGVGGPVLNASRSALFTLVQSGNGLASTLKNIKLYDEAFVTPQSEGYGNFCAFYGILDLPMPPATLTLKASAEYTLKASYQENNETKTISTADGDKTIVLTEGTLFTLDVTLADPQKAYRVLYDPQKCEAVSAKKYKLLGDATIELRLFTPRKLLINNPAEPKNTLQVFVNDQKQDKLDQVQLAPEDEIRLEIAAPGYIPTIAVDGATLIVDNRYKVTGDKDVTFTITYVKDPAQWYTITYEATLEPAGQFVALDAESERIVSGAQYPVGSSISCVLTAIPFGYVPEIEVVGLEVKDQTVDKRTYWNNYTYTYVLKGNASIKAKLKKDDSAWYILTFTPQGTDANGKPYQLKVYAITPEVLTPIAPSDKFPAGTPFFCDFETEDGALPNLVVTGATLTTADVLKKYGAFVYELQTDASITISGWETKLVPLTITILQGSNLGTVTVTNIKDGTKVEDGGNLLYASIYEVEITPNAGCELAGDPTIKGLRFIGEKKYRVVATDNVKITFSFKKLLYLLDVVVDGKASLPTDLIELTAKKGSKTIVPGKTQLTYDTKIELKGKIAEKYENTYWIKQTDVENLEAVTGEEGFYLVKGTPKILFKVESLHTLTLIPNPKTTYTVTCSSKGETKSVKVEQTQLTVEVDDKSQVKVQVDVPAKHILQGITPGIAKKTTEPNTYTFDATENYSVSVEIEALVYFDLNVSCAENGKLQLTYSEAHPVQLGEYTEAIEGNKKFTIEKGTRLQLKALPNPHYKVASFVVGQNQGFPQEGSIELNATTDIKLTFEQITYVVTAISVRGKGTLTLTTIDRTENIALKQGDKVNEGEKLKITYEADPNFDPKPETLKVVGLQAEGDAYVVTGAVLVSMDFVPKDTPPVATIDDTLLAQLVVAPNPFSTMLRISNVAEEGMRYKLFDAQGRVLLSGTLPEGDAILSTETLSSGLYLLQIQMPDGATKHWRVVK